MKISFFLQNEVCQNTILVNNIFDIQYKAKESYFLQKLDQNEYQT